MLIIIGTYTAKYIYTYNYIVLYTYMYICTSAYPYLQMDVQYLFPHIKASHKGTSSVQNSPAGS